MGRERVVTVVAEFPRTFRGILQWPTLCGHEEARAGHCAVDGCGNRWQLCARCVAVQAVKDAYDRDTPP